MPALTVVLDVETDGFTSLQDSAPPIHLGEGAQIEIGALRAGMQSGAPSVMFCFQIPDGRPVVAETSMALLLTASEVLKAKYGDPRQSADLQQAMDEVSAEQQAAMDAQSAQGSTRAGVVEAGLRAALDYALRDLPRDLKLLTAALGVDVDAGAFLLGGLMTTLVGSGVPTQSALDMSGPLFVEYMAKAREACGQ